MLKCTEINFEIITSRCVTLAELFRLVARITLAEVFSLVASITKIEKLHFLYEKCYTTTGLAIKYRFVIDLVISHDYINQHVI